MALIDVTALILTVELPTSLPDPATVSGRTHQITNVITTPVVVSSTGATPFTVNGVNVATATIPAGDTLNFQSDGVHWRVLNGTRNRPIFAATAVSDASGNATFTFPAGLFSAPPVVDNAVQATAGNLPIDYRVTTLTATSCVVNCRQSPALIVLSLSVLGVSAPLAGVTVHLIATPAGVTL